MTDGLAGLGEYVGKSVTTSDVVTASGVAQLAATLGIDPPASRAGDPLPPGWHGPLFVPTHGPQPIFDTASFTIRGATTDAGATLWALDGDGVLSMTADARYAAR